MDKLKVLLIILLTATGGLAASMFILALIFAPSEPPLELISKLLIGGFSSSLPFFIPLSSLLFFCTLLASMVGVVYFLVLPEVKHYVSNNGKDTVSVVLKTLKPEERRVVAVLDANGGRYLQKYISKEADLSRLKTHRIIAALSERGIVHTEKSGNTNEVSLAKWFYDGMHQFENKDLRPAISEADISTLPTREHLLALMSVVIALREEQKSYVGLKQVREQAEIIEKSHEVKLVKNLESYLQDLSDRGILDIRSFNEICLLGVPMEKLDSFLDKLISASRNNPFQEEKSK